MKFAYTIWDKKHYNNIASLVDETKDVADYYIVTTWPYLATDKDPAFVEDGLGEPQLTYALAKCKDSGKKVGLQVIPTPKDARGKEPNWWQGWVYFDTESDWNIFFQDFRDTLQKHFTIGENAGVDFYLLGAELVATLSREKDWRNLFTFAKSQTSKPLGYSHHFCHPLKYYYRLALAFAVIVGYFFRRDKIYADILSRLLVEPYHVPDDQLIKCGKNLYHSPNINAAGMDFIKLNDYFWYVMDKEYTRNQLMERWEKVKESGITLKFMPAIRNWIKKDVNQELWIENDLTIGYTSCSDEYYKQWWEVFLDKHKDLADVIVAWDNGEYKRWGKTIRSISP